MWDIVLKLFLISFFCILICWQFFFPLIEGLDTFEEYDWNNLPEDPSAFAKQNAQNIEFLKEQLDSTTDLEQTVQDLSGNVTTLTQQVQDVVDAQKNYAQDNLPSDPVEISGT